MSCEKANGFITICTKPARIFPPHHSPPFIRNVIDITASLTAGKLQFTVSRIIFDAIKILCS